jgi:hypothetical protein
MKTITEKLNNHDIHGAVLTLTADEVTLILQALERDIDQEKDDAYDVGRISGLEEAKYAMLDAFDTATDNGDDLDAVRRAMFSAWSRL